MINDQRRTRNILQGDTSRPGVAYKPSTLHHARTDGSIRRIAWRLEPRDLVLALLLDEHRSLTAGQISSVLFTSPRTCRNRLAVLRRLGWVDHFTPIRPGRRLPARWVAGPLGARFAALYRGEPAPSPRRVRELQDSALAIRHVAHADGANQFFIDLLVHARRHPDNRLTRWWGAARTASAMGGSLRPDGHGVWREGQREVAFFLEFDTGTETRRQLAAKLPRYRDKRLRGGPDWPVLLWLPTAAREAGVHDYLAGSGAGVTVATAARDAAAPHGPAGPVWRLIGNGRRRLRLADLPGPLGESGPYHPGPPTREDDPLYLLDAD